MQPTPEQQLHYQSLAHDTVSRLENVAHPDLIERMLASVLRMSEDCRRADLKLTASALEEMEHSFDVLEVYADARKVCMFGSARSSHDSAVYQQAMEFARRIAGNGYMVITGAGPGVMEAGNEGAGAEKSFGMSITLPHEAIANPFIAGDPKLMVFKYFFTRKLAFLKDTHAVVLCPGGFGTFDEGFETLTLIQTGKAQLMPVVCLGPPEGDFWEQWDAYLRNTVLKAGMISPEDLSLFKVTSSVAEACDEILRFYRRYHSMRFQGDDLFIRLSSPLSDGELAGLNEEFADLGPVERAVPLEGRNYDASLASVPHLRLDFASGRYGRLRQMIDRINECPLSEVVDLPPEQGEGGRLPVETDHGPIVRG